jgi:Ni/Fe-hydrogenase subunit HybB-like protein
MGMYFLSSILLMRMALPEAYRHAVSAAFGDIKFEFYHRHFDIVFLCSATASMCVLSNGSLTAL